MTSFQYSPPELQCCCLRMERRWAAQAGTWGAWTWPRPRGAPPPSSRSSGAPPPWRWGTTSPGPAGPHQHRMCSLSHCLQTIAWSNCFFVPNVKLISGPKLNNDIWSRPLSAVTVPAQDTLFIFWSPESGLTPSKWPPLSADWRYHYWENICSYGNSFIIPHLLHQLNRKLCWWLGLSISPVI